MGCWGACGRQALLGLGCGGGCCNGVVAVVISMSIVIGVIVGLIVVIIVIMFGVIDWTIQSFSSRFLQRGCWVLSKAGGALGGGAVIVVEVGGG